MDEAHSEGSLERLETEETPLEATGTDDAAPLPLAEVEDDSEIQALVLALEAEAPDAEAVPLAEAAPAEDAAPPVAAEPAADAAPPVAAEPAAEPVEAAAVPLAALEPASPPAEGPMPATAPERPIGWLAFLPYGLLWVALAAASFLILRATPSDTDILDAEAYGYLVAGGLVLVAAGLAVAGAAWISARRLLEPESRPGVFSGALLRAGLVTLLGAAAWAGALIALDALRSR